MSIYICQFHYDTCFHHQTVLHILEHLLYITLDCLGLHKEMTPECWAFLKTSKSHTRLFFRRTVASLQQSLWQDLSWLQNDNVTKLSTLHDTWLASLRIKVTRQQCHCQSSASWGHSHWWTSKNILVKVV